MADRRLWLALLLLLLLFAFPASLIVPGPLGGNGSPARLLGLFSAGLALLSLLRRHPAGSWGWGTAVVVALDTYLAVVGVGMAVAWSRPLADVEADGVVRAALGAMSAAGGGLYLYLATESRRDLRLAVTVLVGAAAFCGLLGIIQYVYPLDVASLLRPPGFEVNKTVLTTERGDYNRIVGTSGHPIEFGVVLAAVVPLALHLARTSERRAARAAGGAAAVICLVSVPLAVSRSGSLALIVALIVYSASWTWRQRVNALAIGIVAVFVFRLFVAGLIGTIVGLFLRADDDPSITGRTEDFDVVGAFFAQSPWLGLGVGTFRPEEYVFLDNQWLLVLVEQGLVGVLALALLLAVSLTAARATVVRSASAEARSLGQAITASLASLGACAATFDLFSFQQAFMLFFVLVGLAASCGRSASQESPTWRVRLHGARLRASSTSSTTAYAADGQASAR